MSIKIDDFYFNEEFGLQYLRWGQKKTSKDRDIPVGNDALVDELKAYAAEKGIRSN